MQHMFITSVLCKPDLLGEWYGVVQVICNYMYYKLLGAFKVKSVNFLTTALSIDASAILVHRTQNYSIRRLQTYVLMNFNP